MNVASIVGVLAVLALGLSAGALLTEGAVLVTFWRSLPPEAFLSWYRAHASLLHNFFGSLEIVSAVLAIAATALYRWQRRAGGGAFGVAAVLAVAVLATFPLYFQDVNASFAAGTIALERVAEELDRFARWHGCRTLIGVGAFAAAILGARAGRETESARH